MSVRESETRRTAMFQAALDCIVSIDHEGKIVEFNPAAEQTFGFRREEVLGREMAELIIPRAHRDQHRRALARYLTTGVATVPNRRIEMPALRADGSEIPVELAISRVPGSGPPHFMAVLRDISERKKAEEAHRVSKERFRLMADAAPVLVWTSGPDRLCTWFNKPWLDFVGRPMELELGNGWTENVHPDDFDRCIEIYVTSFDARQPFSMEYRLRRHDGEYRWLLDNGRPLYDANGEFSGYIGSCMDINEQKESQEALREQVENVEALFETLPIGVFIAHDANCRRITGNRAATTLLRTDIQENLSKSAATG
jgi:hypothetical protein